MAQRYDRLPLLHDDFVHPSPVWPIQAVPTEGGLAVLFIDFIFKRYTIDTANVTDNDRDWVKLLEEIKENLNFVRFDRQSNPVVTLKWI